MAEKEIGPVSTQRQEGAEDSLETDTQEGKLVSVAKRLSRMTTEKQHWLHMSPVTTSRHVQGQWHRDT